MTCASLHRAKVPYCIGLEVMSMTVKVEKEQNNNFLEVHVGEYFGKRFVRYVMAPNNVKYYNDTDKI